MSYLDLYSSSYISGTGPEYQLANQWILQFDDFQDFDFLVDEITLPMRSIETDRVGYDLVVPKNKGDYRTVSITFRADRDFRAFNYHQSWLSNIYDFEKRAFKKTFHTSKKKATVKFISVYNNYKPLVAQVQGALNLVRKEGYKNDLFSIKQNQAVELLGLQITGVDDVSLDNDTGEPLTFTAQYEVQKVNIINKKEDI